MKITNQKYFGDYESELLEEDEFKEDFPNWMSRAAKILAEDTLKDLNKKMLKYPNSFNENSCIAIEVSVSISTFPKTEINEKRIY